MGCFIPCPNIPGGFQKGKLSYKTTVGSKKKKKRLSKDCGIFTKKNFFLDKGLTPFMMKGIIT